MDTIGTSNDRPSVCDQYINPRYDEVESSDASILRESCTAHITARALIAVRVEDGRTSSTGQRVFWPERRQATVLRVKTRTAPGEVSAWNWNTSTGNRTMIRQPTFLVGWAHNGDKLRDEIVQATDRIGSITSHNLFGNLFYDFINTSRFTPYIGVGGGVGFTDMEYGSVWARNEDSMKADGSYRITTGEGLPNYAEIRRNSPKRSVLGKPRSATCFWGSRSCSGWITQSRRRCRWGSRDAGSGSAPSVTTSSGTRYGVTRRICD